MARLVGLTAALLLIGGAAFAQFAPFVQGPASSAPAAVNTYVVPGSAIYGTEWLTKDTTGAVLRPGMDTWVTE